MIEEFSGVWRIADYKPHNVAFTAETYLMSSVVQPGMMKVNQIYNYLHDRLLDYLQILNILVVLCALSSRNPIPSHCTYL